MDNDQWSYRSVSNPFIYRSVYLEAEVEARPEVYIILREISNSIVFLGDPEVTANIYYKSRNLPNTDTQNYSKDLHSFLGQPVKRGKCTIHCTNVHFIT